jgi:D-threo-aldose 1-dehydrogenase
MIDGGRLGLGCAPIGNMFRVVSDDDAHALVDTAFDLGVRLFDTAPLYGHGVSETRLGRALQGRQRDSYVLATKVGRVLVVDDPDLPVEPGIFLDVPAVHPEFDFSHDGVMRSVDDSLRRLGVDRIDLLHVHDPDDHLDAALRSAFPALVRLRDEGVVGAIGLGTNEVWIADVVVEAVDIDWLLLAGRCTLLDQSACTTLFPRCRARGIRVMAAGVFNSGVLADPVEGAPFFYAPAPADVVARGRHLREVCGQHGVPLAAAALQFPLRDPAVSMVLVGARNAAEITEDAALLDFPIPDALWDDLAAEGTVRP